MVIRRLVTPCAVRKPSMDNSRQSAATVRWLGYGGLLPFLAFDVLIWVDRDRAAFWHHNLQAYGAVILSFVGALHWGIAMTSVNNDLRQRSAMFAWSVVPCLMALLALALPPMIGDLLLGSGFLLHYGMDLRIAPYVALPAWYLPLRLRLSVVAMMCLAAGAVSTHLGVNAP